MSKEKDLLIRIGEIVQKKARQRYKSNLAFADECNIAESTVRRILLGKQNLSIKLLEKVCAGLDLKLSDLFKELGK